MDENKSLAVSTEYILANPKFGSSPQDANASLGTKAEFEGKIGILNGTASVHGGREYKPNGTSSIYKGGEAKVSLKTQIGGGIMFKWDIWNGRSRQFKKDLKSKEGQKHEHKLK